MTAGHEALERLEETRERLRAQARETLGVGVRRAPPAMTVTLRQSGVGWYPAVALGGLAVAGALPGHVFGIVSPDVARSLGIGTVGAIAALNAVAVLARAAAPLAFAAMIGGRERRAAFAVGLAATSVVVTLGLGFVVTEWGLGWLLIAAGVAAAGTTLHAPLLVDSTPSSVRVRALSLMSGVGLLGSVGGPLVVAGVTAAGYTWRAAFVAAALLGAATTLLALRLRDPGYGRWDSEVIRAAVHEQDEDPAPAAAPPVPWARRAHLGLVETSRRLLLIPTFRRQLGAMMALGAFGIPFATYLAFVLDQRYGLTATGRALFAAGTTVLSIVALQQFGPRSEALLRRDPPRLMRVAAALLAVAVVTVVAAAVAPALWLTVLLFALALALVAPIGPALFAAIAAVVPGPMRVTGFALLGVASAGPGGLLGVLFVLGIEERYGTSGVMVALLVPGLIGSALIRSSGRDLRRDVDRTIDEIVEAAEIELLTSRGVHLPLLACRGLEVSYGGLPVLFDVSVTVDDGEIVALVGTNGAGKSTVLRAVSGLVLPSRGSVRWRGEDITYVDVERRLGLGIVHVQGGAGVFADLTVAENLRMYAYSRGRRAGAAVDEALALLPVLAGAVDRPARSLSGGEQHLLALARTLLLRPRLLLLDELSLGLAPTLVEQVVDLVRAVHRAGAAVLVVEQSLTVALDLADRAYFLERGQVRFEGPADHLAGRTDLLRAVFVAPGSGPAGGT